MAEKTEYYGFWKPTDEEYVEIDLLNENFDAIDAALKEIAGQGMRIFDNPLAFPNCTRTTTKTGNLHLERIRVADGSLRAERVTNAADMENITETYTFYAEDGETVAAKFEVCTKKDADGNWTEEIKEGAI